MVENEIMQPSFSGTLVKSNEMISAKYKASHMENRVMAKALTRIEYNHNKDGTTSLEAKLYPKELKEMFSDEKHIYRDLKKIAKTIVGHTMFLEDGKGNFKAFSIVPNADYNNGVFRIEFNKEIKQHIFDMENRYTILDQDILQGLKCSSSFRIYELLRKDLYRCNPKVNEGCYVIEYNIAELKFTIGLANGDVPEVKKAIADSGNKNVDWDGLYAKLDKKDRKYDAWYDLQRKVLIPAQKELAERSDLRFEYRGIRKSGHKFTHIEFKIYRNPDYKGIKPESDVNIPLVEAQDENVASRDIQDFQPLYDDLVGHNGLTAKDIDILLKDAEYDAETVWRAVEYADTRKGEMISNYMGYLRPCIRDRYFENTTPVMDGSAERAKRVIQLQTDVEESKKNGDLQRYVWQTIKEREDFQRFEEMLSENSLSSEKLMMIYPIDKVIQIYYDWRLGKDTRVSVE